MRAFLRTEFVCDSRARRACGARRKRHGGYGFRRAVSCRTVRGRDIRRNTKKAGIDAHNSERARGGGNIVCGARLRLLYVRQKQPAYHLLRGTLYGGAKRIKVRPATEKTEKPPSLRWF